MTHYPYEDDDPAIYNPEAIAGYTWLDKTVCLNCGDALADHGAKIEPLEAQELPEAEIVACHNCGDYL